MTFPITSLSSHVPCRSELNILSQEPTPPISSVSQIGQEVLCPFPRAISSTPSKQRVIVHAKRHYRPPAQPSSSSSSSTPASSSSSSSTFTPASSSSSSSSTLSTSSFSSSSPLTVTLKKSLLVDKVATLEFLLAKAIKRKTSNYYCPPNDIPLKKGQINIVPTIPRTHSNLFYVDQSESMVVPMSKDCILVTKGVATCIAATAVGFNTEKRPICRGLIHFDGVDGVFEDFISQMKDMGAVSIHLNQVSGIDAPCNRKAFNDEVSQSEVPIVLENSLLNFYNLSMEDVENFEFEIDLIEARMTMGICQDGSVFAIKDCVWETVNIEKIRRLHRFVANQEPHLDALAKVCRHDPQIKGEVVQDLISILQNILLPHALKMKTTFFDAIGSFLNSIRLPVV